MPVADILNILCDVNLFSLYLMNFMFYTMLDAACNIQRGCRFSLILFSLFYGLIPCLNQAGLDQIVKTALDVLSG